MYRYIYIYIFIFFGILEEHSLHTAVVDAVPTAPRTGFIFFLGGGEHPHHKWLV